MHIYHSDDRWPYVHPFILPPVALRNTLQPFRMRIFRIGTVLMQVAVWRMGYKSPGHGHALGTSLNTQIDRQAS